MSSEKILYRHEEPHGPGDVYFLWQNGGSASLMATTGSDATVAVFNRQGQLQDRIILQSVCSGFAWDSEGDVLAILCASSSQLTIWDSNTLQKQIIDTGLRDPLSLIVWSKTAAVLAVGTARGNLAIYNHQTTKRIPILGKHSKRITCGAWSSENLLALGGDDKTMTLSTGDGDSLRVVSLRDVPTELHFAEMKTDERIPGENTVSMILGKRTLYLYHLPDPESPTELGFQARYGALLQHKWFGDGYVMLGFSNGHVVAISTHMREVGQELWQVKNHKDNLTCIAISNALGQVATCGDNNIKIHATSNLQETISILNLPDRSGVKSIDWSADGQLLAVSTGQGAVTVFVTKLHTLFAVSPPRIALLTSLTEVSLFSYSADKEKSQPQLVQLEIEPSFLAIGPFHLVCGMNNHVWFYDLGRSLAETPILLGDREYLAEIRDVRVNALHCAVLCGGQVMLHPIETQNPATKDQQPQLFPSSVHGLQESVITCMMLTNDFLTFATDLGNLVYFAVQTWTTVLRYRHSMGIKQLFGDTEGTKLVFVDDHNQGYIYLPTSDEVVLVQAFPKSCSGVLWDCAQPNVFVAFDDKTCVTFVYVRHSVDGRHVIRVGDTPLLSDQTPIMLLDGELSLSSAAGGKMSTLTLATHKPLAAADPASQLTTLLQLRKYTDAWEVCKRLDARAEWQRFGRAAVADLDVTLAIKVYRQCGCDAAMVMALEDVLHVEDVNFVSGMCAVLLDKADRAKSFFAKSANPLEALELCRDLLQWEQAMSLAETLAPEQMPFIAREYAQQLEFTANHAEALLHYERGLAAYTDSDDATLSTQQPASVTDHIQQCRSGIARTSIQTGHLQRGIQIATQLNNPDLLIDCGEALAARGHHPEAAALMERAGAWDRAGQLYVQLKAWPKVQAILPKVTSTKLYAVYARAKEAEGNYAEAIRSYTQAGEVEHVIRIHIEHMHDPHSASELVLESRSVDGARMLAKFYQHIGDHDQALQYLILCGCISDAFALAQRHNKLQRYGELLDTSDTAQPSDYLAVATYFESEKHTLLAGKYYFMAREHSKALKLLLKASKFSNEENTALSLAIDCVASANDDRLAAQLIEFLLGEVDGTPKDAKYLFRLYMARKHFKDAAKTAVIIGQQEQIAGNYRAAHDLLFTMCQELRRNHLSVAADMRANLTLLHRYTLVRVHVKLGDHLLAARLLVQVAASISQFPTHIVPILTSTVVECQRADLTKSAFAYAAMLMRPEYRAQIDAKYAKKIEAIVRKAPRGLKEQREDELMGRVMLPCPVCDSPLAAMELTCHQCKTTLPICIATGQHIAKDDLASCPECDFPCFKAAMIRILDTTNQCPMCAETVDSNRLSDVTNVAAYLAALGQ